ncbi:NAD(P)-dependent oxidoreductase [Agriterribacter sp.]|uniref:NAD-dependent epimerase/dehydratase family protein n=1 Tax=Agriterribacter sp. TaxID=2821509 RepID=UPI002C0798F7|nr:NAD(P)-dependent oxidoreductase [Agriterribacter sp.]HRO45088.1 NAD(P)-dependent oxidoreductase [Agriterribacter sp.]HRQ15471.1 NAD(P)-dependent oxidoreductase [Agriterribacter sp.]
MKVLVTGASGFIGNYVVKQLLRLGHYVIASSSNPEKAKAKSWFRDVTYINLNLSDYNDDINYFDFFFRPDIMIHLAWEGLPDFKGAFHVDINLPRHKAFLQNMICNGLRNLSVTGTCLEYGMQEGALHEDLPVKPTTSYGIAKSELWNFLLELQSIYPVHVKWIRLFYMYGEGQNPKSLLSQLQMALDNHEEAFNMSRGDQSRDYLPVEKVAEYAIAIALQQKVTGIINCCSGEPVTVKQFVENYMIEKNRSIKLNTGFYDYPDYEPMHFWGDKTKLKTILYE